jgi:hypothetical protein
MIRFAQLKEPEIAAFAFKKVSDSEYGNDVMVML